MHMLIIAQLLLGLHAFGMSNDEHFSNKKRWLINETEFYRKSILRFDSASCYRVFYLEKQEALARLAEESKKNQLVLYLIANDLVDDEEIFSELFPEQQFDQHHRVLLARKLEVQQKYLEKLNKLEHELTVAPNCHLDRDTIVFSFGIMDALSYLEQKNLLVYQWHPSRDKEIRLMHYFSLNEFDETLRIFFNGSSYSRLLPVEKAWTKEECDPSEITVLGAKTRKRSLDSLLAPDAKIEQQPLLQGAQRFIHEEFAKIDKIIDQEKREAIRFLVDSLLEDRAQRKQVRLEKFIGLLDALKVRSTIDTRIEQAEIYLFLGKYKYRHRGKNPIYWLHQVFKLLIKNDRIDAPHLVVAARLCLGNMDYMGQYGDSAFWYVDALKLYRTANLDDPLLLADIYLALGNNQVKFEEVIDASSWFLKALDQLNLSPVDNDMKKILTAKAFVGLGHEGYIDKEHPSAGDYYIEAINKLDHAQGL